MATSKFSACYQNTNTLSRARTRSHTYIGTRRRTSGQKFHRRCPKTTHDTVKTSNDDGDDNGNGDGGDVKRTQSSFYSFCPSLQMDFGGFRSHTRDVHCVCVRDGVYTSGCIWFNERISVWVSEWLCLTLNVWCVLMCMIIYTFLFLHDDYWRANMENMKIDHK